VKNLVNNIVDKSFVCSLFPYYVARERENRLQSYNNFSYMQIFKQKVTSYADFYAKMEEIDIIYVQNVTQHPPRTLY
jgi:hypothetical protein